MLSSSSNLPSEVKGGSAMKHTGERNVMLASLGKKPRSFPADKNLEENSWPENNNRGNTGHDSEQLGQQWLTSTRPFSQTRTHNNCAFLGETVLALLGIMAVAALQLCNCEFQSHLLIHCGDHQLVGALSFGHRNVVGGWDDGINLGQRGPYEKL